MLVRPLENRAFEILHLRVTGGPQPVRHRGGTITDRAVGDDRRIFGQITSSCFGIRLRIDSPRSGQMTHLPLRRRSHIEEHRRRALPVRQPISQLAGSDPALIAEFAPQRAFQEKPFEFAPKEQSQAEEEQPCQAHREAGEPPPPKCAVAMNGNPFEKSARPATLPAHFSDYSPEQNLCRSIAVSKAPVPSQQSGMS